MDRNNSIILATLLSLSLATGSCGKPAAKKARSKPAAMGHDHMAHDHMAHDHMAHDHMAHDHMAHDHMGHGNMGHGDKHRPFGSVKTYISHLDRKDRDLWQKPEAVITKLGLGAKNVVTDVGAGSGYFALRIAKRYPQGRVIATDVEPKMLAHIQTRAKALKLTNVTTVLATSSDPKVDSKPDLVLVADVLHHVPNQPAWLAGIFKAMKPGARLAVIEFKEGNLPKGPPAHIKIPRKKLLTLLTKPGFQNPVVYDKLLPYQILVVLQKPPK